MRLGKVSLLSLMVALTVFGLLGSAVAAMIGARPHQVSREIRLPDGSASISLDAKSNTLLICGDRPGQPCSEGGSYLVKDASNMKDIRNLRWGKDASGLQLVAWEFLRSDDVWIPASRIPGKQWYSSYERDSGPEKHFLIRQDP